MPEVSGTEFLNSISRTDPDPREFEIENDRNEYVTIQLYPIERDELFDQLHRLPEGFLDMIVSGADTVEDVEDIEDPDDVDIDAGGADLLKHLDGSVINVFEELFATSAKHEGDLTSLDMDQLAEALDFDVLFEAGGEIIDLSLQDSGSIKGFREVDSDKSS